MLDSLILRHDQQNSTLIDKPSHELSIGMLEHLDNHRLRPAASIGTDNTRINPIPMHRLQHFFGRHKHIVTPGVWPHKTKSVAMAD
jgi:hypothetical protein